MRVGKRERGMAGREEWLGERQPEAQIRRRGGKIKDGREKWGLRARKGGIARREASQGAGHKKASTLLKK